MGNIRRTDEFGHAIHGLNSDVTYPSLAGTNVPADFAESEKMCPNAAAGCRST